MRVTPQVFSRPTMKSLTMAMSGPSRLVRAAACGHVLQRPARRGVSAPMSSQPPAAGAVPLMRRDPDARSRHAIALLDLDGAVVGGGQHLRRIAGHHDVYDHRPLR